MVYCYKGIISLLFFEILRFYVLSCCVSTLSLVSKQVRLQILTQHVEVVGACPMGRADMTILKHLIDSQLVARVSHQVLIPFVSQKLLPLSK